MPTRATQHLSLFADGVAPLIDNLLNGVRNLSDHWAVVIGISLVFFVVQTILSMKLFAQAWDQDRFLRMLRREFDHGESGRPPLGESLDDFPWLDWVLTAFPTGDKRRPPAFNRDTALHELDTRIASEWSYLLLQRMGIMAPLLGVVLTVIGFYWLKVDGTGEQSLQTILVSVTPLVSGVGAGAVLALLNQFLLQSVGGRLERLRMSARSWFDAVIWPQATTPEPSEAAITANSIETFATLLVGAAHRHAESSDQIKASTASLKLAASQFEQIVGAVREEIKGVPAALSVIRDATAASAQALHDLIPASSRAVANLDVSVAAFRTAVDQEFIEAAKIHHDASKSLAASAERLQVTTEGLSSRNDELTRMAAGTVTALVGIGESLAASVTALNAAGDRAQHVLDSDIDPSRVRLNEALQGFAQSADKLAGFIEHGIAPATQDLAALHHSLSGLHETIEAIGRFSDAREDIDRLTDALSQAATIADSISSLPEQLRAVLEQTAAVNGSDPSERRPALWSSKRPR